MGNLARWCVAIAVAVALAAAGASCGSSSEEGSKATPSSAATTAATSSPVAAALTWTVVSSDQSPTLSTTTGDKQASQGVWVTIELEVANGSSSDASVGPADVKLVAEGKTYEVSPETMLAVPNPLVAGTVPAGGTAKRAVVFDVPQRAWVGGSMVISGASAGSAGEVTLPLHK